MTPQEMAAILPHLTPAERAEVETLLAKMPPPPVWAPLPGPQKMAYDSEADIVGYGGAAGGGKGLALDTPIATPDGWSTMGDLRIGDALFAPDGSVCRVAATSEVQHRDCYRLTFDDGASLVADDVHRWATFDAKELAQLTRLDPAWREARKAKRTSKAKGNKSEAFTSAIAAANAARQTATLPLPQGTMRDTAYLAATLRTTDGRTNHAIQVPNTLVLPEVSLPIPPYTLGAWLGDGTSRNAQLTGIDPGIWERIEQEGFEVRHYSDKAHNILGLLPKLRAEGLLQNKHIPMTYLRSSYAQRLALLQGLMDTDGHAALDGGCEYDGVCETLVRDVLALVLSLGIKATLQTGTARLNGRAVSDKWRVKFVTSLPVFGLPRKLERLKASTRRTTAFRYLKSCERIDTVPTRCIAVDSPSRMFLAGHNLIPTHNTDLACGLALTKHKRVLVCRRQKDQTRGVVQRLTEIIGTTDGYSSQQSRWNIPVGSQALVEFGGLDNLGDEASFQGRPHDLKVFDETCEIRESQVRFVMGWMRSSDPRLKCKVLCCFNPPTNAEGRWVVKFFAPWLDKTYPGKRALPGELRWFTTISGKDMEVPDSRRFVLSAKGEPVYDFNPKDYKPEEVIKPTSRTFIPARLVDNPYYMATGYMSTLQALPEPLRSQMLNGDFSAGIEDDSFQLIPTQWVEAAQARWIDLYPKPPMDSVGIDVARGGKDQTTIARRHAMWFDRTLVYPGSATPDGPTVAGLSLAAVRDGAPMHIDVIGVGASPYDYLNSNRQHVIGVNVSEKATATDLSGRLQFKNQRSQYWWQMREALDPANNSGIMLPPEPELLADLTAPRWRVQATTIYVEGRDEIYKRIGRSPDHASAYILAMIDTPKLGHLRNMGSHGHQVERPRLSDGGYDPYANLL